MAKSRGRNTGKDADVERTAGDESVHARKGPTFDAQVSIRVDHYRLRLADPDGLSCKAAIDGLVHCGVLRDDSAQEISEIRHVQHKVKNAEEERTVITITEVEPGN